MDWFTIGALAIAFVLIVAFASISGWFGHRKRPPDQ